MAFDSIPKNLKEVSEATGCCIEEKSRGKVIQFYLDVVKEGKMDDPFAFNPAVKSGKSIKIARALNGTIDLKAMKKKHGLDSTFKVTWGDGSRGNRGTQNTGNLFEKQLEDGLNDWIETNEFTQNPYKEFIKELVKTYNLEDCQIVKVINSGPLNTKRPMSIENGKWKIGTATENDYDIGKVVTDLTLETKCPGKPMKNIYLSLKKGGTTTLSNLGVKKSLSPAQIINGQITDPIGLKILETFGIDNDRFCTIFNEAQAGQVRSGGVDDRPNYNNRLLLSMIRGSIGYGYHYTHLTKGTNVHGFPLTKKVCDSATNVRSVKIYYGGQTGTAERINIEVKTATMELKFNIRDTSGSGSAYPDKLQSGYKFDKEAIFSIAEDGYDD
tara:strand:- start:412 stop:1563 length:1152 start_codon:yes stop_codon:yes gene_type:complete